MAAENKTKTRAEAFVKMVIDRVNGNNPDTAFGAIMRRADNPATEDQSWEYLTKWCDLEKSWERKTFALIGAAIAHAKPKGDGGIGIGKAIAWCYSDEGTYNGNEKSGAKAKFRRLLACDTIEEACAILRPLLRLIDSREVRVKYAGLLQDLLSSNDRFNEWIKPRWAKDFYNTGEET
jgi:CRISPR system Cascade subunit CasB